MVWRDRVLELMRIQNVSQKELAEASNISESSISRYLKSDKEPRMDVLVNIAKALNVKTDYLLDGEDKLDTAYNAIAGAIARKGGELTMEETHQLIEMLIRKGKNV